MHRITINVAWTQRRRAARHSAHPIHELFADPHDSGITPEQAGSSARYSGRASKRRLPSFPQLRAVVVLKDVHDWSHAEIAEQLGITVTAAKVRLHRARRALRTMLWDVRDAVARRYGEPMSDRLCWTTRMRMAGLDDIGGLSGRAR